MGKFKVGDTVTRTIKSTYPEKYGYVGVEYEVLGLVAAGWIVVIKGCSGADPDCFDLVVPDDTTTEDHQQHNPVSKPSHYNVADGIECITYIKQVLGKEGFVAYCRGNQIKYQHRAMYKGNSIEDLEKAHQYNAWAIETLKELPYGC
jgi:hypothetical protein